MTPSPADPSTATTGCCTPGSAEACSQDGADAAAGPGACRAERMHRRAPSAALYMLRALHRRPPPGSPWPALRWEGAQVPAHATASFERLTGLACVPVLPSVFVHTWTMRPLMSVLTDTGFPLPIWQALQLRTRLRSHRPLVAGGRWTLRVDVAAERRLPKGCEIDLHAGVHDADGLAWEGLTTFYWRGRRRGDDAPSALAELPPLPRLPGPRWHAGRGASWRFGALTGDYNPLHGSDAWARRMGFAGAFQHPSRAAAEALARIDPGFAPGACAQQLDLWFRGPVRYGRALALAHAGDAACGCFALHAGDDPRPAIVGRWACSPDAGAAAPSPDTAARVADAARASPDLATWSKP